MASGCSAPGAAGLDKDLLAKIRRIRLLVLDVDGVLTDGGIVYSGEDLEGKRFHVRDGAGIKLAQIAGLEVGILTGRASEVVARRAEELGITRILQGSLDKARGLDYLLSDERYSESEVAFVGDDLLDLAAMRKSAFRACPGDAHESVRKRCDYVCRLGGGQGAVREVIDLVLEVQGRLEALEQKYWEGSEDE